MVSQTVGYGFFEVRCRTSLPVSLVWLSDLRRYEIFSRDILVKILIAMDKGTKKEVAIPL